MFRSHLLVCAGTGCIASGSLKIKEALISELEKRGLSNEVRVIMTGCNGFCAKGPVMTVHPDGIFYQELRADDIPYLVEEHLLKGRPVKRFMFVPPEPSPEEEAVPLLKDINFFGLQVLIALRNRGVIDPESIDEYIAKDGYAGMAKALTEMNPEGIIEEVKSSGLRGRGGAGFPTGMKWMFAARAKGDTKYMLCNGDEGDPGAFMDRSVLEADPHAVLEGMVIGARAIGAHQGYIYVRAEYPLAVERLGIAIKQAREYGLLGNDILGSGFDFDIDIYMGAGAFVCGEETALMTSIMGKRGMPRPRPPFPAHKGLWDKPSVLNNVETLACVPTIIRNGARWFSSIGTEKSKGTKVFALTGAVNNIGLVEVPMGTKLSTIIYDIGGGIKDNRELKAVQIGGPSGGCLPKSLIDTPVDYESITKTGAIMGSGGMVVIDDRTCMVDLAKFFLGFTADESCGKCVPCRIGTKVLLELLDDITRGEGKEGDIEKLEDLGRSIINASLCGLGQTAPNPVLTTIRYFREEYEEHIQYKRCPSVACRRIISSPCQYMCPIDQDVPSYVTLIAQGKYEEAIQLIREANPLPSICGRACPHYCERKCKRGELDEPVAIRYLKRFAADYEYLHKIKTPISRKEPREEKVAVIGSGPAGLTAAYFLGREGFDVTVFEALPVAGGMLAVGIPEYRVPKDILKYDIGLIEDLGVNIRLNSPIGKDLSLDDLFDRGFKAIFIGVGCHRALRLGIPGEDVEGVIDCLGLLRRVNLGEEVKIPRRIGVIGGGNVAMDTARVAKRLGSDVTILYRRTRAEMPADKEEVDAADDEGIKIEILTAPQRVISQNGRLTGLTMLRMELGEPDESGRRRPVPIKGSEYTIELDAMIPAISQEPDLDWLKEGHGIEIHPRWHSFMVDEHTMATNRPGIFAGGDAVTGPKTIVDAMAAGKIAAASITKYLNGEPVIREYHVVTPLMKAERIPLEEIPTDLTRPKMPEIHPPEREGNFREVEIGFTEEQAKSEGMRCLRCDLESE